MFPWNRAPDETRAPFIFPYLLALVDEHIRTFGPCLVPGVPESREQN